MALWKAASIVSSVGLIALILTEFVYTLYRSSGYARGVLLVLVPLGFLTGALVVLALCVDGVLLYLAMVQPCKRLLLTRFGMRTTGVVIRSAPCYAKEDTCLCGAYRYHDQRGHAHDYPFTICIHWPNAEQCALLAHGYALEAESPVYYLRWFPRIHDIHFPL